MAPTYHASFSTEGKEESKISSLWGSIDKNEISTDKKVIFYMDIIDKLWKLSAISDDEYVKGLRLVYDISTNFVEEDKAVGLIPKVCDNPILDTLICW